MEKVFESSDVKEIVSFVENLKEDAVIILRGDFYGELSLCNKHDICVEIKGENARIFGTARVKAQCERYSGNIYKTKLQGALGIERLWVDDKPFVMARYPNAPADGSKQVYCTMQEALNKIKADSTCKTAYIRALHSHRWGSNCYRAYKDVSGEVKLEWVGNNNRGSEALESSVIVENVFNELDCPNEFYYNNDSGELFFYSEENISTADIQYSVKQTVLNIENCDAHFHFSNIGFHRTDNSMFKCDWQRYLRSDWAFNTSSGVKIKDSSNITFSSCVFSDLGNTAVQILNDSSNIEFDSCDFVNSFSGGILIRGDKSSTYCSSSWENDNHITYMEHPDKVGERNNLYPKGIVVDNCLFKNLGTQDLQCAGVCISLAKNVTVKNSTVCYMPRAGINICENAFGGHKIIGNDIYECVRETGDHGPFNSWGRDRFWSLKKFDTVGKYGRYKRKYALIDMTQRNEIAANRVNGSRGFGIDLDDGSSGYDIHHNLCIGVGIKLREGFKRRVYNNVIIDAPIDYHCAFYKNSDIFENNIVCNTAALCTVLENKGSNAVFKNNYHVFENARKSKRFNALTNLSAEDILEGNYNLPHIEPLSASYGCDRENNSNISVNQQENRAIELKARLYTLMTVNESIKTSTGLPDYNGLFIVNCSLLSPIYRKGLRKGDVIISCDEVNINENNYKTLLRAAEKICIFRNQKQQVLNIC